jgi:probable rRNA maturation factor
MGAIQFHNQSLSFKPPFPRKTSRWIQFAIQREKLKLKQLNFIFCTDAELLRINMDYLKHNTYTDIITFDNSEERSIIEGDIFISIDRVTENANNLGVRFIDELHRVMIHGVLHLVGFSDKSQSSKKVMRRKEDEYLSLREI